MSISFAEVHHPNELINRELRAIARHSSKSRLTTWYCVRCNSEEVAFLAVGRSDERLVPYQLVVPHELRGRGIGSAVLRAVEHLAQSEGYESVRLWPRPLDDSFDQWGLERWYSERGYKVVPDGTGDMEKRIARVSPERAERLAT
jgi:GNAT superfamily N-acetyltransferase